MLEAFLLLFPFGIGLIYNEYVITDYMAYKQFWIPIFALIIIGFPLSLISPKYKSIYAKEGFVIVALSWIILSLVGAVPFVICGAIPNYVDALFETVSGFTTTGASILSEVESLSNSMNFWRMFTHWIGGMGVLVFVLAILPNTGSGAMNIYRAETPGPTASKILGKINSTARILYLIYILMTIIEFILLVFDMPVFDAVVNAFATAGTGGFAIKNTSIGGYSHYSQWIIAIFMFLFGVNFNVFYLILIGKFKKAFGSEEVITYTAIVLLSTIAISINLFTSTVAGVSNFSDSVRNAFFQVTSLSSSTGFSTTNYDLWPTFSKSILLFLMLFGACAGSTGGGMKVSRLIILSKSALADIKKQSRHREIISIKFEGEVVSQDTVRNIRCYFFLWFVLVVLSTLIVSLGGYNGGDGDLLTSFSASIACIGNIGPGFNLVGPAMNFGGLSAFSKIWLSLVMLAGRLEIIPIMILFNPKLWAKK